MMRAAVARPPATPPAAVPPPSSPAVTEPDGDAVPAEPSLATGDRSAAETKEAAGPSTAAPLAPVDAPEDTATEPAESAVPPRIVIVKPAPLTRAMPRYPPAAERLGLGRTVTLRVLVGTDGRAEQVERVGPKAGLGFDRAAEEAAFASTWRAGSRDGEPTSMWVELRFEFRPDD
jgi:protein TonB